MASKPAQPNRQVGSCFRRQNPSTLRRLPKWIGLLTLTIVLSMSATVQAQFLWPQLQHDSGRTGRADGPGAITAPVMMWRYFMGGDLDQRGIALWDVDGDGTSEIITLDGGRIVARDLDGAVIWDTQNHEASLFWGLFDIDVDGTPELLFQGGFDLHILDVRDGIHLWQTRNQARYMLVANVDADAELEIVFRNDTSVRGLRVYDFSAGIEAGSLKWESDNDVLPQHSFELVVGDIDAASEGVEIVIDNNDHGRLVILNAATGDILRHRDTQIHNGTYSYGHAQVVNVDSDDQNEFVFTGSSSGASDDGSIQIAVYDYGTNAIQWHYEYGSNTADKRLDTLHNGVVDLDDDGSLEVVISVYNNTTEISSSQDGIESANEWVTIVFDGSTGTVLAWLDQMHAVAIVDLDADGTLELVTQETRTNDILVPRFSTIRVYDFDGGGLVESWSLDASSVLTELPSWDPTNAAMKTQNVGSAHNVDDDGFLELLVVRDLMTEEGAGQDSVGDRLQAINGEADPATVSAAFSIPVGTELGFGHYGTGLLGDRHLALTGNDGTLRICDVDLAVHVEMQFGDYLNDPLVIGTSEGPRVLIQDSRMNLQLLGVEGASPIEPPMEEWTLPNLVRQNLFAYDRDGDGTYEILRRNLTAAEEPILQLLDEQGEMLWQHELTGSNGHPWAFVEGEFGAAGVTDYSDIAYLVTYAGDDYRVESIDGAAGTILASNNTLLGYYKSHNLLSVPTEDQLYVIHSDTSELLDTFTLVREVQIPSSPHGRNGVAADFDGDGHIDIFPNEMRVAKGVWRLPVAARGWWFLFEDAHPWHSFTMRYPGLSQGVNNPIFLDLALAGPNGDLSLHEIGEWAGSPAPEWVTCLEDGVSRLDTIENCSGSVMSPIATGDVDGDETDEFVIGGEDGYLYVINSEDGSLLWSLEFGYIIGAPRLADLNYDPSAPEPDHTVEILVSVGDGYIYAIGQATLDTPTQLREVALTMDGEISDPSTDIDEMEFRHQMGLVWAPVAGADGYRYAVLSEHGTQIVPFVDVGSETQVVVSGLHLVLSETYHFQVQAYDFDGGSSQIAESDGLIITDVSPPTVDPITIDPVIFNPNTTTTSIETEISDPTGLASYELVIRPDGSDDIVVQRTVILYSEPSHSVVQSWDGRDDDASEIQSDGTYQVTVTAVDVTNKTGNASNTVTIDTLEPIPPVITQPTADALINNNQPAVGGTAEANNHLVAMIDATLWCETDSDGDGNWSCTPDAPETTLTDGPHSATATAKDAAGNESAPSSAISFTVDALAPSPPVIGQPTANALTTNNRPTVGGTAEANSHVVATIDATVWCETDADGSGNWSCIPVPVDTTLAEGAHCASATAEDAAGHTSDPSVTVNFVVDTIPPPPPVLTGPIGDGSNVSGNPTPMFTGTSEPVSAVTVFSHPDVTAFCSADTSGEGIFACAPDIPLSEALHTVVAIAWDAAGNESGPSDPLTLWIDTNNDIDEDTLPNQWESDHDLNPFDSGDATADPDGDTLSNIGEYLAMADPQDADSDDDGVIDGEEPEAGQDSDDDGLNNVLDPDADDDGVVDGVEMGITEAHLDTDTTRGFFFADADPTTTTSAILADSDDGGQDDGAEDWDHNGRVDSDESDPSDDSDDGSGAEMFEDADADGLTDFEEIYRGIDPDDADTDDDGVLDGAESNWTVDMDQDDLLDVLDPDSDNDGLADGLEVGLTEAHTDTDLTWGRFLVDADPSQVTSMVAWDTDGDGLRDGLEDSSYDGAVDEGESDPVDEEDGMDASDRDDDGLSDAEETTIGSMLDDADSDDDGVLDGDEWNWWDDQDRDDIINVLDHDSDGDGVFDGTERGYAVPSDDTALEEGHFQEDTDTATTTKMLVADSDGDTLLDGEEDLNANGQLEANDGESDPNDPTDPPNICAENEDCGDCEECIDRRCEPIVECGGDIAEPIPDASLDLRADGFVHEPVEDVGVEVEKEASGCGCELVGTGGAWTLGLGMIAMLALAVVGVRRRR